MKPFRRALPSLNALMSFEAAARNGSFTLAARELGVTQAAVSRQVQALEADFGVLLFRRSHRKVELTAAGTLLAGTLTACFERIRDTAALLREPQQGEALTVGATIAFSHFWLLPRIAEFRAANPNVAIRIVTQDHPFDLLNDDVDVIIRFADGAPRGGEVFAQVPDVVYPVAARGLRGRLPEVVSVEALRECSLIASDTPDRIWISWPDWFEAVAGGPVPVKPALRFSNYTDCIQAAVAGHGVALGWDFLIQRLIKAGHLVRLPGCSVVPSGSYQLVAASLKRHSSAVLSFVEWSRKAFETEGGNP